MLRKDLPSEGAVEVLAWQGTARAVATSSDVAMHGHGHGHGHCAISDYRSAVDS